MMSLAQMVMVMGCVPGSHSWQMPLNAGVLRTIQACKNNQEPNLVAKISGFSQRQKEGVVLAPSPSSPSSTQKELQEKLNAKVQAGENDFARDTSVHLQKKIAAIIAAVQIMPTSLIKNYWHEVIKAYEKKDVDRLELLQYEHPDGRTPPLAIHFFILSIFDNDHESMPITLLPMDRVRQGAFFKKITGSE